LHLASDIIWSAEPLARAIPQPGLTLPRRRGKPPLCDRLTARRRGSDKARPHERQNGKVSDI